MAFVVKTDRRWWDFPYTVYSGQPEQYPWVYVHNVFITRKKALKARDELQWQEDTSTKRDPRQIPGSMVDR